jgi:hypothetical protein
VQRAIEQCRSDTVQVEILAVLDRADAVTKEIFERWTNERCDAKTLEAEFGDLGLSRNFGVSEAQGKWIAFIDADDLWTPQWLASAYRAGESEARRSIWHPEINLYFGERPYVYKHVDMDDPIFNFAALAIDNPWTALCFAERELFVKVPYRQINIDKQLGYEDWGWNLETISVGAVHKTVLGTAHCIRSKSVSLVSKTAASYCLPRPCTLFRNIIN